MVKIEKYKNIEIIYDRDCEEEKNITRDNFDRITMLIYEIWGFKISCKIKIYIVSSELKYILLSYPLFNKILICTILLPFWLFKERKIWKSWSGTTNLKSKIPNMLIKPMKAYDNTDLSLAEKIYKKNNNHKDRFRSIYCQNLLHLSYIWRMPMWLEAGLAMVTEYKFNKNETIKNETIKLLERTKEDININEISLNNKETVLYNYVKGYWTVRYLEENYPGFLKEIFKEYKGEEIVEQIILKLGLDSDNYWEQLDELLYENYKHWLEK